MNKNSRSKILLNAISVYLLFVISGVLVFALISKKAENGVYLINYFSGVISCISAFAVVLYLRISGSNKMNTLIFTLVLSALLALTGIIAGEISIEGALRSIMFTLSGAFIAMIFTVKNRRKAVRLKSLHK